MGHSMSACTEAVSIDPSLAGTADEKSALGLRLFKKSGRDGAMVEAVDRSFM
jgi:hypothetical protein